MDSISSYEFHKIFDRVTKHIDLKDKFTVGQIEEELRKARKKCERLRREAESIQERAKLKQAMIGYGNLLQYGFASRAIYEAKRNPNGMVGMTLKYGKREAKRRMLAQKRAEIRRKLGRRDTS